MLPRISNFIDTVSFKTFREAPPTRVTGRLQAFVFGQGTVDSCLRGSDVTSADGVAEEAVNFLLSRS